MFEENNPFKEEDAEQEQAQEELQEAGQEDSQEAHDLQAQLDDMNNKYIRLAADFDNYRKRQAQERAGLLKYGAQETLSKLLIVLDTIERAGASVAEVEDCQVVKDNYQVVFKQLDEVLQKCGLEKIESQGEQFDPNLHEAVMQTPTSEHPDGYIILQLQSGYKLGDKVLRPSLVNVATSEG